MNKLFSFLFLFALTCFAQHGDNLKGDAYDFFKAGGDIYSAPAHFDKNDWVNLSGTFAATSAAYIYDDEVREIFQKNKTKFLDNLFEIDRYYHIEFAAASVVAIYGYGLLAKDEDARLLGLNLGEASFYASVLNLGIKSIFGRVRPEENLGSDVFRGLNLDPLHSSLASAHSTLSFAYSTVMADFYDNPAWKAFWFSAAGLVALARIYHDKHWLSDVVLGAAIGYFIGKFVVNRSNKNKTGNNTFNFSAKFAL